MSQLNVFSRLSQGAVATPRRKGLSAVSVTLAMVGLLMTACVTAADRDDAAKYSPADVPVFDGGTAKELSFSKKRLALVFAVDEDGKVQVFRAPETKVFSAGDLAQHPLHAGSIAAFKSFSIIKTTNPKICWLTSDGTCHCIYY